MKLVICRMAPYNAENWREDLLIKQSSIWRARLRIAGIPLLLVGINNIFDLNPPFAAGGLENGYDESSFNIKGRFWYVALKKRF